MHEEELKKRNIYFFKPSSLRGTDLLDDYDDFEWTFKKLESATWGKFGCTPTRFFKDIDSKPHRHIFFMYLKSFYIDLDKVDTSLFNGYEIPRKFVDKIKRNIKLNSILNER